MRGIAAPAGIRRAARLMAAVAILAGLFAMHGAAGPGLAGCHGPVDTTAAAPTTMSSQADAVHAHLGVHAHRPGAASSMDPLAASHHLSPPRAACLSTLPRRLVLMPPLPLIVAAVADADAPPTPVPVGPADLSAGGVTRGLLTRLCICRT